MSLLATCASSLEKRLFRFFCLFSSWSALVLSCRSYLHILDINPLSGYFLTPQAKINSKWNKDFRPETLKPLKEDASMKALPQA